MQRFTVWLGIDMLIYHQTSLVKTLFEWKPRFNDYIIATDDDDCIVVETFGSHSNKVLASEVW